MLDPLPRFIPGPLNLYIRHWATFIKSIALNRPVCFVSLSAVSILRANKSCPRESHRFRLALFCSLLKVYSFWTCRVSILHQNSKLHTRVRSNTPAMRKVNWMNSSRHNKNANRCKEIPAFIREKNMFCPSIRSFEYSVLITTEASKLKKWYSDQP